MKQTFLKMQHGARGAEGINGHDNLSTGADDWFVIVRRPVRIPPRVAVVERLEVAASLLRNQSY